MARQSRSIENLFKGPDESEIEMSHIYARIPAELHNRVLELKEKTGKTVYEIVEAGLRAAVEEFDRRNSPGYKPDDVA